MPPFEFTQQVSIKTLAGAIITGLECGSYASFGYVDSKVNGEVWKPTAWQKQMQNGWPTPEYPAYAWFALHENAEVVLFDRHDPDEAEYSLTEDKIRSGLEIMARAYPEHLGRILQGDGTADALDCDGFLQVCIFGEWMYA